MCVSKALGEAMGNEGKHDNSCMVLTYRQVGERDKHINNISKVISTNVIRARRVLRVKNRERIVRRPS